MLRRLWTTSPELVTTAALMAVVLTGSAIGLVVDPTVITGAPAWLKPAKFAVSIGIYTLTLAWIFTRLPDWPRTRRVVGWTTAATLGLEVLIIAGQAWRGTTSHFNIATPLDGWLFRLMGVAIVVQTVSTIPVAVALWRQRFVDPALGAALRLGMTLTIVGAFAGGLMVVPTQAQIEEARAGRPSVAGAHTVGAADGGPGLPGTGWSTEHGDLRVAHFVGLHALQVLPVIGWLLGRWRLHDATRVRLLHVAAGSYVALFVLLVVQALRGIPLVAPDPVTLTHATVWIVGTALAAAAVVLRDGHLTSRSTVN